MSALILFEVVWLGADGHPIGRKAVRKRDLTAAANYAARKILHPMANRDAARAHGFYVRSAR